MIFTLAFILFLSLTPFQAWPAYVMFLTLILSVTLVSRLGLGFVLKRSLLAIPFFLAAAPLIFVGPPPHAPVPFLWDFQVVYSPEGCARFISIAVRSWISVQAAILLAATTRFPDLLAALHQLKVPAVFIAIIGLMWRYLFLMGDEVARMLRARSSRGASAPGNHHVGGTLFWRASVTGGMAGSLFLRSIERSDRVYAAMLSRGYTGKLLVSETVPLSSESRLVLLLGGIVLVLLWIIGLFTGG